MYKNAASSAHAENMQITQLPSCSGSRSRSHSLRRTTCNNLTDWTESLAALAAQPDESCSLFVLARQAARVESASDWVARRSINPLN